MALPVLQKRRMSIPWTRPRRQSSTKVVHQSVAKKAILQHSRLLSLPAELQDNIFDFIAAPWSLGVFDPAVRNNDFGRDDTLLLSKVGSRLLAGPPGFEVLLVCRALYEGFRRHYWRAFTGRIVFGKLSYRLIRKLGNYLTTRWPLRRFNDQVHTVSLAMAMSINRLGLDLRRVFPRVRLAECLVYEGSFGPLLQLHDNVVAFLTGRLDLKLVELSRPTINHTVAGSGRAVTAVHVNTRPWDDDEAALTVSVLGTIQDEPDVVVGITYRWQGSSVKVLSRVYRSRFSLRYWEEGTDAIETKTWSIAHSDDDHVPERFRWVNFRKW